MQQVPSSPLPSAVATLPQFVVTRLLNQRYSNGPTEESFLDFACIALTPGIMTPEQSYSVTLPIGIKPRPEQQAQMDAAAETIFRLLNDRIWVGFDTKICFDFLAQYFASIGVQPPSPVSMIDARNLVPVTANSPPSLAEFVQFFHLPEQRLFTARGECDLILELLQRCSLNQMLNTHYLESLVPQPLQGSAANSTTARKSEPYEEMPTVGASPMQGHVPADTNGPETGQFAVDTKEDRVQEEPQQVVLEQRVAPAAPMKAGPGKQEAETGREEHKNASKSPPQGVGAYGRQPTPPMPAQHYMALEAQMDPQLQAAQARVQAEMEIQDGPPEREEAPTNGYAREAPQEPQPEYQPAEQAVEPQAEEPEEPRGAPPQKYVTPPSSGQADSPEPPARVQEQRGTPKQGAAQRAQPRSPAQERRDDISERSRTPSAGVSDRGAAGGKSWKNLVKKGGKPGAGKSPKKVKTSVALYGPKAKPPKPQPINPNYKGNNYDPNYQQRFQQGYKGYHQGYQSGGYQAGGYQRTSGAPQQPQQAAQQIQRGPPPKTLSFTPTTNPDEIRERIDEAIQKKATIWMRYAGGINPGIPRGVSMRSWHNRDPNAFFGVPHKSRTGDESKFFLNQVQEVRCWHWRVELPEGTQRRSHPGYDKSAPRYARGGKAPRGRRQQ